MTRAVAVTGTLLLALTLARPFAAQLPPRLMLELEDYAALPITADNTNENTRAQLARVNYLRDEPGGRRFFVNDLNGLVYILDKQTKTFTPYNARCWPSTGPASPPACRSSAWPATTWRTS
jgi:hypothetical protein